MATYRGVPYEAAVGPANSDVVLFAACPPPEALGFEPATGHWRKQLIRAEIDALWESRPVGFFRGEPCIVLDDLDDRLHVAYLGPDTDRARQLGYWQVDRGVFEVLAPKDEVTGLTEERVDRPLRWSESPGASPARTAYPYGTAPWPTLAAPEPAPAPPPAAATAPAAPLATPTPAGPAPEPVTGPAPAAPPGADDHTPAVPAEPYPPAGSQSPVLPSGPSLAEPADQPLPDPSPAHTAAPPAAGPLAAPPLDGPLPGEPALGEPALGEPAGPVSGRPAASLYPANGAYPVTDMPGQTFPPPPATNGLPATAGLPTIGYPGHTYPGGPGGPSGADPGGRAGRKQRVPTRDLFCELADLAAIPRSSYALEIEVDGAMCLLPTPAGFEVFAATGGARHEVRTFAEEETAYFYLFGVLAAEAIRNGTLAPTVVAAGLRHGGG